MSDQHQIVPTGFQAIHANHLEDLRKAAVWIARTWPVPALENDTFLVQSNGIAQWLKLALAEDPQADGGGGLGVAAATDFLLPSRFIWQAYRGVLGRDQVPEQSPFDKNRLVWRLFRLLPDLPDDPIYQPLRRFLEGPQPERRRFQLAEKIADLYDQYQVFRADWLADWERGANHITLARQNERRELDDELLWQPLLWRLLVDDVGEAGRHTSRAGIHTLFMERGRQLTADDRPAGLPRRILVFGVSSLPQQTLEALDVLARFSQVVLCVHNPCEYYWADIVSDRDLLRANRKRGRRRQGMPAEPPPESLHLHAQPLLAAWGKQGRDYIRLLDAFDDPEQYRTRLENAGQRVDLFDSPGTETLLHQLQDDIRTLRPLTETRERWRSIDPGQDHSIAFHRAHSPQREVEILHDQLLAALNADPGLRPRDIMVMVPDINVYAAAIQSVFGRHQNDSHRHIPFTISDQGQRHRLPVLVALETLLSLPDSRFSASDVISLLEVPAVRQRFAIDEADLPQLHQWVDGANIRWGLNAGQRASMDLPEGMDRNTWQFGLRRMLLGYSVGAGEAWSGIEPYPEVGGLQAGLAGQLDRFIAHLGQLWTELQSEAGPSEWAQRLTRIREDFFAEPDADSLLLFKRLDDTTEAWLDACDEAGLCGPVPLTIVRDVLLDGLEEGGLNQRFLAGKVNFATLMPMRAIPFKRVCLLGMNDGDYPRTRPPVDFDLMAQDYRPGDRSRREDDRYLFLEALLSAREQLYISWVGRSIRDNSERPASVLVAQLRDHLDAGWGAMNENAPHALAEALTTEHPLQPFSRAYFSASPDASIADILYRRQLFTFEHEWHSAHDPVSTGAVASIVGQEPPLAYREPEDPIRLADLVRMLKQPVASFYQSRLQVYFTDAEGDLEEAEPFSLDGLKRWSLQDELIETVVMDTGLETEFQQALGDRVDAMARRGDLGMGVTEQVLREEVGQPMADLHKRYQEQIQQWPVSLTDDMVVTLNRSTEVGSLALEDRLGPARCNAEGQCARVLVVRSEILRGEGKKASYQHRNLFESWVSHLAANSMGISLDTVVLAKRGSVRFTKVDSNRARDLLQAMMDAYMHNLTQPIAITPASGFAWLEAIQREPEAVEHAQRLAQDQYEQDLARDAGYLRRFQPDFASFWTPRSEAFVRSLYEPLWQALSQVRREDDRAS